MVQQEFTLTNASGLHTRPGNEFVKKAKQFSCTITLTKGNKTVDGKSLLKIMKTDMVRGDQVSICCNGDDEEEALRTLGTFLTSLRE